jgi:hypothetical protein
MTAIFTPLPASFHAMSSGFTTGKGLSVVWACTLNANKAQQAIASNAGLTGFMKDPPKRIAVHLKPAKASKACSLKDS